MRSTSSGSAPSDSAVKPTRSQKSAVTTFRSWVSSDDAVASGLPQLSQKRAADRFACAHMGQTTTVEEYRREGAGGRSVRAARREEATLAFGSVLDRCSRRQHSSVRQELAPPEGLRDSEGKACDCSS